MTTTLNGIVHGLAEDEYHARPELSSTQARQLLDSPARYHYARSHPQSNKAAFDLGTAVHSRVLGTGAQIIAIPVELLATNGAASTKAAKDFIEQSRADGLIPVKEELAAEVQQMTEAVLAHPNARLLFEQDAGQPEASVFATDPDTGVELRARFDFLGKVAVDLKTTAKAASASGFAKSAANLQYEVQEGHYIDTLEFATGETRKFVFVVVETEPPYLTAVHMLDRDFAEMGKVKARRAREIYAECTASGVWPGYPTDIGLIPPPMYAVYDFQDNYS
jgi:hypothetical protein